MKKIRWISNWSDNWRHVSRLVAFLKSKGLRAKSGDSIYVGHRCLFVDHDQLPLVRRALREWYGSAELHGAAWGFSVEQIKAYKRETHWQ